ncbi:MAG: MFS transporter [Tidjanibacter sp.]|nr:MFS transporter [Tidjanibacter sp.]MBR3682547.1 MFS transporter [Tidjanibacter sp.]MBR3854047.1 MFS transporter [Tidjanibacter sp.]
MKVKGLRWVVLSLIVLVTIINYLDRGTLNYMWVANTKVEVPAGEWSVVDSTNLYLVQAQEGVLELKADEVTLGDNGSLTYIKYGGIAKDLGLVDTSAPQEEQQKQAKSMLAVITMFFMIAYGVSQLFSGKVYDKIGTRKGFTLSALLWGAADALASLSSGLKSLTFFRVMLGLGEAGPWPGTTKSNAEWFPQKERALAQGIFGAAASAGSIIAPILIPVLFIAFGWKITFIIVGSLGIIWVVPWLIINKKGPKEHPWITEKEQKYIIEGQPENVVNNTKSKTYGRLFSEKKNYAVILGRFFLDPIWWMFVTWLPIYLIEVFGLDIKQIAMSAWVPYVGAAVGSIAGGWFSGWLIKKGKSVNFARKCAVCVGACMVIPGMILAAMASSPIMAVVMMALILGGYQFMMTNIQTVASDLQTGKSVGTLAGIGGAAAVCGTLIMTWLVPIITAGGNWVPFFIVGAALVPLSLLSIFIFGGKIEQTKSAE